MHWGYELVGSDFLWFFSLKTLYSIKISEKTLNFDNIEVNIDSDLVNVNQIVIFDQFKHSDDDFKYFIGY